MRVLLKLEMAKLSEDGEILPGALSEFLVLNFNFAIVSGYRLVCLPTIFDTAIFQMSNHFFAIVSGYRLVCLPTILSTGYRYFKILIVR